MEIKVNGKPMRIEKSFSVSDFLFGFDKINPDHIVVELNGKVLKKTEWGEIYIKDGDNIELIEFVGGG